MSAFNTNHRDGEYPIINVEAENEHFATSDTIIAWLETCKTTTGDQISSGTTTTTSGSSNVNGTSNPSGISTGASTSSNDSSRNEVVIDHSDKLEKQTRVTNLGNLDRLCRTLPPPSAIHQLSAPGMAWGIIKKVTRERGAHMNLLSAIPHAIEMFQDQDQLEDNQSRCKSPSDRINPAFESDAGVVVECSKDSPLRLASSDSSNSPVRMRGNDEWAPPRAQIIFNIHEESNFKKLMQRQNYRCAGCGTKIDLELARRLVLYCHYLGKYFCKCCYSHKSIHLPGYILQRWDFHKYPVSHFALSLLDRIANEPLFNINDINPSLYRKVKKLRHLVDIRMQLYYLKIYISTCIQTERLDQEYASFGHQHLLQDDVHIYSLNNLIEIQHGKLYEYLNDLVSRSIAHIARCDRCRAKGHYCQLCGPSSLISSMILSGASNQPETSTNRDAKLKHSNSAGQNIYQIGINWGRKSPIEPGTGSNSHSRSSSGNFSNFVVNSSLNTAATTSSGAGPSAPQQLTQPSSTANDHELIFPFEIGRVAQCRACGCCFHLQCFKDAGQNCPKCERIQRRNAEMQDNSTDTSGLETSSTTNASASIIITTTTAPF